MFDWTWILALAGLLVLCLAVFAGWFGTLTLWLGIYVMAYAVLARWLRRAMRWLVALPVTIIVLFAIPAIWAVVTKALLPRYQLPDVAPAGPIVARGHISVDAGEAVGRSWKQPTLDCDASCLVLLFTPSVDTVTVSSTVGRSFEQIRDGVASAPDVARTYRLLRNGDCNSHAAEPYLRSNRLGSPSIAALEADWHMAREGGTCLIAEQTRTKFDLVIRNGVWGWPQSPYFRVSDGSGHGSAPINKFGFSEHGCNPSPSPPPNLAGFSYSEVRSGTGRLLFRQQYLQGHTLAAPLTWYGNRCSWGWSSTLVWFAWRPLRGDGDADFAKAAGAAMGAIGLRRADRDPEMLPRIRLSIDRALNSGEPTAVSGALSLLPVYLDALQQRGPEPVDTLLVSKLISAAPPTSDLREARRLSAIFDDEAMSAIRRAAARKLLATPPQSHPFGALLASIWLSSPRLRLDDLYPEERELLREASQDYRAVGLIQRLPELGAQAAPLLVDALLANKRAEMEIGREWEDGIPHEERNARRARSWMTREIEKSLCRLGPAARGEYARLRLIHQRTDDRFQHSREWDKMMYRVGGPEGDLFAPSGWSGTNRDYREQLAKGDYPSCEPRVFFK